MGTSRGNEPVFWDIHLRIPIPRRLARRASDRALGKHLAQTLLESFQKIPPDFVASAVREIKADIKAKEQRLIRL